MLIIFCFWLLAILFFNLLWKPCNVFPEFVPTSTSFDTYEEKPSSSKTNKIVLSGKATQVSKISFWFPNALKVAGEEEKQLENIFTGHRPAPLTNDAAMRINIYSHENSTYQSLLSQPILIDSQYAAGQRHNLSAYLKPDCLFGSNTILIVQREYLKEIDFPNLLSVELR